ncbi:ankyrin repeat domain-containing protein [Paraburkholderia sp. ZP32-5]|uniref:ankyrin repeat domain-containing protein n=1 Tax=Paraburkholderia sp. ZP32-5 TaxID=2883245 RepID=UPI001F398D1F|nr:ankyrin repeat domain-containing protein [Paraburkholderia sp. ZP32-5]
MKKLPAQAHPDHLKKQAKELLRLYRAGNATAIARFIQYLPAAAHRTVEDVKALALRLHDAQSCIAREYGFVSWADLTAYADASAFAHREQAALIRRWLGLVYGADVTGTYAASRPRVAVKLLLDHPDLVERDPYVACAAGYWKTMSRAIAADPGWVNQPGGALRLPPLVAVTHSSLVQIPEFAARLRECARALVDAGADPNQQIGSRLPPASLSAPDMTEPLSTLYGAAGVVRDPALTEMLLNAGAEPNDGESLYHSLENPDCTRLLLQHGARVTGSNALWRALDMPDATALELLLGHGGNANESSPEGLKVWGTPLLRAIALHRSPHHIAALIAAGADVKASTAAGVSAYRLAMQVGLVEIAAQLRAAGAEETLTAAEQFVSACALADAKQARRIQTEHPDLPRALPGDRLRLLPDAAAWGSTAAVKTMVELGWPLDVRGGDWDATALNHSVFRGDVDLTAFLLEHGASWRETQGFGSDALGTLAWASQNEPSVAGSPDWAGCARVLIRHGVPKAERDPEHEDRVLIDGRRMSFSGEVTEVLVEGVQGSGAASRP